MSDSTTKNFATGMQRSAAVEHLKFSSIHPIFTIAIARTLAEGATKYGDSNWELGSDILDNLNHVEWHLAMYKAGDRSEAHLEHAATGLMFAIVNSILHPELSDPVLRGPGCTMTPGMIAALDAGKPERQRRREAGEFKHMGEWKLSEVPEVMAILSARKESREPRSNPPRCGLPWAIQGIGAKWSRALSALRPRGRERPVDFLRR